MFSREAIALGILPKGFGTILIDGIPYPREKREKARENAQIEFKMLLFSETFYLYKRKEQRDKLFQKQTNIRKILRKNGKHF